MKQQQELLNGQLVCQINFFLANMKTAAMFLAIV